MYKTNFHEFWEYNQLSDFSRHLEDINKAKQNNIKETISINGASYSYLEYVSK